MTRDGSRRPDPDTPPARDEAAGHGEPAEESYLPPGMQSDDVEILEFEAVDELGRPLEEGEEGVADAGSSAVDPSAVAGGDHQTGSDADAAIDLTIEPDEADEIGASPALTAVAGDALRTEFEELQERHIRLLADFDNYRRRRDREADQERGKGVGALAAELLSLLDNLERAVESVPEGTPPSVREGIDLILKQAVDLLERHGVEPVEALGETFNPEVHEAMDVVERDDFEDQRIIEQLQRGYVHNGRLLRPALVRVVRNPARSANEEDGAA